MGIPKELRISKNKEFREIYTHGLKAINRDIILFYKENEFSETRLGITISSKVGNAVTRNSIKRVIREIYRKEIPNIKKGFDIILIMRKPIKKKSFQNIEKTFIDVFKRAGLYTK